jgi:hypothetical protein
MTSASVTGRLGPRIPSTSGATPPSIRHELPLSTAARHPPVPRSGVTETSDSGQRPTADQRNRRYDDPSVFLARLFLAGALLPAMFFFLAPAVILAAPFVLAPF